MIHYTLNSGDVNEWEPDLPSKGTRATLKPLIENGGGPLPEPLGDYWVELEVAQGCAVFTIHQSNCPLLTCGLAWSESGADGLWSELERLYLGLSDKTTHVDLNAEPLRPTTIPWIAEVHFLPEVMTIPVEILGGFLKFEFNLAMVILTEFCDS